MCFTPKEKAHIVAEHIRNQSVTRKNAGYVRRLEKNFLRVILAYNGTLDSWKAQIFLIEGNGRPRTSEQTVEQVRSMFQDQYQLSIRENASALDIL